MQFDMKPQAIFLETIDIFFLKPWTFSRNHGLFSETIDFLIPETIDFFRNQRLFLPKRLKEKTRQQELQSKVKK